MSISFRHLNVFKELMRLGSVSGAAKALRRTQPAVSATLSNLESELGLDLFERRHRRLVPKPEAYYFLKEVDHILNRLNHSVRTMREISRFDRGHLRIGCLPAAANFLLPDLVATFVENKPKISVSLMMHSSREITEWVASQQYDIGIVETPEPQSAVSIRSFELECVCVLRRDDPLATKRTITPASLHARPMATLNADHPIYHQTKEIFAWAGVTLVRRFELQTFLPALELVRKGLCVSLCDVLTAASYREACDPAKDLVFRPLTPAVTHSLSILTPAHRPHSLIAQAFERLLIDSLTEVLAIGKERLINP